MANGRIEARCDNCGQTDDHPKLHYGAEVYHHDCIPARVQDDLDSVSQYELVDAPGAAGGKELRLVSRRPKNADEVTDSDQRLAKIIKQAKSGKHGERLLAYIDNLHKGVGDDDEAQENS